MEPILFVHGLFGSKKEYQSILRYLRKRGFSNFYEFEYKNNWGQVGIKKIAKELADFVDKNIKEDSFNIVAISQGGIISLTYLRYSNKKLVGKLFTICSPHQGTFDAYLLNRPGLIDLRPGSELLKEVEEFGKQIKTEIFATYTPFDLTVFPGWYAKPRYGKIKMILAPAHPLAPSWPSTKKFIYKNI